jgi:hypothetical protein
VRRKRLLFAAQVRNERQRVTSDIELRAAVTSPTGKELAFFSEAVPYCPAQESCWWASSYDAREYSDEWLDPDNVVTVSIESVGGPYPGYKPSGIKTFTVERTKRGIRGKAPATEGKAYLVAFVGDEPRGGIGVNIRKGMGFSLDINVPNAFLPSLAPRERLRGFMYPSLVELD